MEKYQDQDDIRWCYRSTRTSPQRDETFNNQLSTHKLKNRTKTIHVSIGSSNIGANVKQKKIFTDQEKLFSFSLPLSTYDNRLKHNLFVTQNEHPQINTQVYSNHQPTIISQLNHTLYTDANGHSRAGNTSTPIEKESQKIASSNLSVSNKTNKFTTNESSINEYGNIFDKNKRRKQHYFKSFCTGSKLCILLFLLIGLLLVGAIIGSVVGVLTISNKQSTASIATTTLTTTMVNPTICSCLCPDESWRFDSGYLARWSFDDTFDDLTNTYNITSYNAPSFVTNGYVNQAIFFNATATQSLYAPYIPLAHSSFTVEVWLKPTFTSNIYDHSILGLCPSAVIYECLHLVIRKIGSNHYLYLGFFGDDCQGNTPLTANQWIHAAFVFDATTFTQSIYLNGELDANCTVSSGINATSGLITIGTVPNIIPLINMNFYEGYMDHLTITKRAKSACEIREDATLVGCFLFDVANPYTDIGPNSLLSNSSSTSIISSGYHNEAISFNGTAYFQALSFTALGFVNKPFSIVLWIRPRSVLGPIAHISSMSNGKGWCLPFLGISSNGSIVGSIYSGAVPTVIGPYIPMLPIWSHIVQTWSSTNGLRVYMNGTLVASLTSAVSYAASGTSNFITLASSRNGEAYCAAGGLGGTAPRPLDCDIDDFRVYSRELTTSDISLIYQA